jgi:hypothetical protein
VSFSSGKEVRVPEVALYLGRLRTAVLSAVHRSSKLSLVGGWGVAVGLESSLEVGKFHPAVMSLRVVVWSLC